MEARQTTANPDCYLETLRLHPETIILDGRTWYSFRSYAKKKGMPYSTVVTWAARKKLEVVELHGYKYVSDKSA